MATRISLVEEFEHSQAVVYGWLANPKLEGAPGQGTTEFHFENIIKAHPDLPPQKMILLSRYLPILDPKDPPRYVMFFSEWKKNLEPYTGRHLTSTAILDFLREYQEHSHDSTKVLLFAAKHFDHPNPLVAEEAFLIFARANDQRISALAKQLSAEKLRKLVQTRDLEPERLSLFALLLGGCGNAGDADLLRSLLQAPGERNHKSYEGILAGYITMRPQEGWKFAHETLKSEKQPYLLRRAVLRTINFFYNANREQYSTQVMQGLGEALTQPDIADVAIQDLCKWKRWEHTKAIVGCYDRKSHQSPIVKNAIVRYALACPLPEARDFLATVRRQDPELVHDLEEAMNLDR